MFWFSGVLPDSSNEIDTKIRAIAAHLYKLYSTKAPYEIYPDARQFLQNLEGKRKWFERNEIKVGVLSNYDKRIVDIADELEVSPYFDFIVYSEECQSSKPEKAIFEAAIVKSHLKSLRPEEIVHIGDNLKKDYLAAKTMGWNALLLQRDKQAIDWFGDGPGKRYTEEVIMDDICDNFLDVESKIFTKPWYNTLSY